MALYRRNNAHWHILDGPCVHNYYFNLGICPLTQSLQIQSFILKFAPKMNALTKDVVQKLIRSKAVVLFTKSTCPFCIRAEQVLSSANALNVVLNKEQNGDAMQKALIEITSQKKVPQIFINQKFIGGFSELSTLYSGGQLTPLLEQAKRFDAVAASAAL